MVLHISPYSSACLHFLDGLSWSLVFPCYWLLDRLLASCVATSLEKQQRSQDPCSFLSLCLLVSAPLYLLLLLTSLPFALLGFVIWAPLQAVRQPYLYTYRRSASTSGETWCPWLPPIWDCGGPRMTGEPRSSPFGTTCPHGASRSSASCRSDI